MAAGIHKSHQPIAWNPGPILWKLSQMGQKYFYPIVTRRLDAEDVVLLNFGYEEDPPMAVPLVGSDEPNRFCIQMYHRTATQVDLAGKQVLEVGCGHGGGASYLTRTLRPASYTGLDLNPAAIALCKRRHREPGLEFVQGNAENLPFPSQSFDVVINIESSCHYPHFPRFLAEVARVLRPDGHLLYADFRQVDGFAAWDRDLAEAPLRMVSQREINAEVMRGSEGNTERWLNLIDRHVPTFLHGIARDTAAVQGSKAYQALRTGDFSYRMYCFAKDESESGDPDQRNGQHVVAPTPTPPNSN